ncbi:glucoamylase family protein [Stakelama saccharophila]|uniref:Glucoamylase family protein n=1 Tax=Stakelama saccharophila TaxID=3075605 RepID=A0ABZ0BBJ4_9SPHN|nr:glucoamylase family protein [Stakelama sp. W311]WNO54801.1 glucoamylase family protein [Stakelama sp. W311]
MNINRRTLLATTALLAGGTACAACAPMAATAPGAASAATGLFDDIAQRTFRFFWDTTNPKNGLAPDRWPSAPFASIAATGFALTAYPIGVANGWISRAQARERTLATLTFFRDAPQGPAETGVAGHKGFFYHFLDLETGLRYGKTELSSVDTTLLLGGILFAGQWFDQDHPDEARIRDLAQAIYARVEWPFLKNDKGAISMGWHPESGMIPAAWVGYNEGMLVNILALGAPRHAIDPGLWDVWCSGYDDDWRGSTPDTRYLAFAPHFGHQYSHVWVDFRNIQDKAMRGAGLDYFENSRRATYAQRAYAIANPMGWQSYSRDVWGLTACDGPGGGTHEYRGEQRQFRTYSARGPVSMPDAFDDGTIAPTAAVASLPFAPEIVEPAARALRSFQNGRIYGEYGFLDAFNPSFVWPEMKGPRGTVDPQLGWVDDDMLGIDQGPILAMIANHQSDFVWKTMRDVPAIRTGLQRAGFTGGWLDA